MKLITEVVEDIHCLTEDDHTTGKRAFFIEGVFMQANRPNRNKRQYSLPTLQREVTRYNEEYIKQNRAYGELGHPACFPPTTQILTVGGWKFIKDTTIGESVYSLNTETNSIEETPILNVINDSYSGQMIRIKNGRSLDITVTPNHRLLVKNRKGEYRYITAQSLLDNTHEEGTHLTIPLTTGDTSHLGVDSSFVVLPGITDTYVKPRYVKKFQEDLILDTHIWMSLLGLYLSEGNCVPHRKSITICQNIGEKSQLIDELFAKLPPSIQWSVRTRNRGDAKTWTISDGRIWAILHPLGLAETKHIPEQYKRLAQPYLETLVDWFLLGDGRGQRQNHKLWIKCDLFSISKKMVEDFSEILFRIGRAFTISQDSPTQDYQFAGRTILAVNKRPLWKLLLRTTENVWLDSRFVEVTEEPHIYNTVHCITNKNQNFYAKENGKGFWTGNSPTINLERVSHMIKSLKLEGSDFIGKAKIIDTPYGNIVKSLIDEGARLGVSSRGMGNVSNVDGIDMVLDDFYLATAADIVADPSAPDAFVRGIMENKEWMMVEGHFVAMDVEQAKKRISATPQRRLEEVAVEEFKKFLRSL